MPIPERRAAALKAKAAALGFDVCRIAPARAAARRGGAARRVAGARPPRRHGVDGQSAPRRSARADARSPRLSRWSASITGPTAIRSRRHVGQSVGAVSVYARHRDYHDVLKGRLKLLASWFASRAGGDVKVFVDTAPLMEKPLAQAAGLGWQGKHTNLVSREFGSWLFLGALFVTVDLPPDAPERDHCGRCRACLDACPTQRLSRALSVGRAPLRLLPDDRAQGADPARVARGDRQPRLWLRRLPGRLSVEQVRRRGARSQARRARIGAIRRSPNSPRSTTPPSAPASPARRSSASGATASCATC